MVKPRIAVKTMGCRLNHAESASIRGLLCAGGFAPSDSFEGAHGAVIHTCAVTGTAQREAHRLVRTARRHCPGPVVVSGCAATVDTVESLIECGANAVVCGGTGEVRLSGAGEAAVLSRIVSDAICGKMCGVRPEFNAARASIKIQNGCSFRCSYCIVPDARGAPVSRPAREILQEAEALASAGFREIVLTGVNVACWQDGGLKIDGLIELAGQMNGIARIRLSSIEPGTAERGVIDMMARQGSRLCRSLHFPLQSGSAKILRLMRRRYSPEEYADTVEYAVSKMPLLGLGADIITGFPGETDSDFEDTLRMVRDLPFSNLHVFPYSERPGTPAASLPDPVDVRVRRDRARIIIAEGERKRRLFAGRFIGRTVDVLVERVGDDGIGRGWTGEYLETEIEGCSACDQGTLLHAACIGRENERLLCTRGAVR